MIYRIVVTPSAKADIFEALAWFRENSQDYAERWLWELSVAMSSLMKFPERCPVALENEAFDTEVRQRLFGKRSQVFKILFSLRSGDVFILRVRSTRQRLLTADADDD
jgi:plasmid stabilization system protein ParE